MSEFTSTIGSVTVSVALGNMVAKKAKAYIVPEFNSCASYGGVGGAVARAGASAGLDAFQEYIDKNGKQKFGQVVVTPSYGGNAETLLHVVSVASKTENEFDTVRTSIFNTLKTAEAQGISTIVAPALGTGIIGQLTNEQSAKAMMAGINDYAEGGGKPVAISFIIWDGNRDAQQAFAAFKGVLETGSYKNVTTEVGQRDMDIARWMTEMDADAVDNAAFGKTQGDQPKTGQRITTMKPVVFKKKG